MRLTILRDSGTVAINGVPHTLDMASIQPEIMVVEWYDDHGSITYRDGKQTGLGDVTRFKTVIDAWYDVDNAIRTR